MNTGAIIIIDDDEDDLELLKQAFDDLKIVNKIISFKDGVSFLDFVKAYNNRIFFILCDINMPLISGLELKRIIYEDETLRLKCMPFIFLSTGRATDEIMLAYSLGVQGYFLKPNTFSQIKTMAQSIVHYWMYSQHPNL